MNKLIKALKQGIRKDILRQGRLHPTSTTKSLQEKNDAMIQAAVKLEIAYDIVKGLLVDNSTFGDRERAYRWLQNNHQPDPQPEPAESA